MLLKNQRCLCNVNTLMEHSNSNEIDRPSSTKPVCVCEIILLRKMNGKSVEWQPMSLQIYANLCKMFLCEEEKEKEKRKQKSESERNHLNETLHSVHSELFILFSYRSLKNRNIFLHKNVCVLCVHEVSYWVKLIYLQNMKKKRYLELNRVRFARSRNFLGQRK